MHKEIRVKVNAWVDEGIAPLVLVAETPGGPWRYMDGEAERNALRVVTWEHLDKPGAGGEIELEDSESL